MDLEADLVARLPTAIECVEVLLLRLVHRVVRLLLLGALPEHQFLCFAQAFPPLDPHIARQGILD